MLQDLLTFASPREPAPVPSVMRAVIGEAAAAVRADPAMAGIRVRIRGDDPTVPVDRVQMHVVFLNLLLNAAQAMGLEGEIDVGIAAAHGECKVTVADRGSGIAPPCARRCSSPSSLPRVGGPVWGSQPPAHRRVARRLADRPTRDGGGTALAVLLPLRPVVASEA